MDLSIIVVAYNVKDLVMECFDKIKASVDSLKKEIIFVDNGSSDGTVESVKRYFPEVLVIASEENLGFSRANNLAYQRSAGEYVLMLNSDAFISKDTLQKTVDIMKRYDGCGILGCEMTDSEGRALLNPRSFPTPWRTFLISSGIPQRPLLKHARCQSGSRCEVFETDWMSGSFLLTRRSVIEEIGFLDKDLFFYYDDSDFCLRAKRKGWKVMFYPGTKVVHLKGATIDSMNKKDCALDLKERFKLQSGFIYYRKNYGVAYMFLHFFCICLFDLIKMTKRVFSIKGAGQLRVFAGHIRLACESMAATKYGKLSVY